MSVRSPQLAIFIAIFMLSGFSGLIYESIWSHYLKLLLGHASYAQVLVLAIFMGGMAIGSFAASRWSKHLGNLILCYGIIELLVGISGIAFHSIFVVVQQWAFESVIPSLGSEFLIHTSKWTVGSLLILPQSILLGATFPFLAAGIIRKFPESPGNTLAGLYFANSFGAAIGILCNSFIILPAVGLPGSILTAGIINIILAIIVYRMVRYDHFPPAPESRETNVPIEKYLLFVAALTGLASFLYEIAWIRMLTMVLGGSTHSFEIMLAAFILGLAIGGFWIRKRIDKMQRPVHTLAIIQVLMGIFAALTIPLYDNIFELMSFGVKALNSSDQGHTLYLSLSLILCLVVMLPATICAGMTLPIISYILLDKKVGDSAIGKVYAWNTVGAIFGVLLASQVIMPVLGLKSVLLMGAAVDLALGGYLFWVARESILNRKLHHGLMFASIALLLVASVQSFDTQKMSSGVFRYGLNAVHSDSEILFHEDGKTSTVAVRRVNSVYALINNGKPDAGIYMSDEGGGKDEVSGDEPTMVLLGALPYIYKPDAKSIANIGMGSGLTAHTILLHPEVQRVDTVEIEEQVYHGAKLFADKVELVFSDPRSKVIFEDAKTFFAASQATYDVIVSEPPNPWVSGVAGLFTTEFYRDMKQYLAKDGVLVQWMHVYELNDELLATVYKALSENFQDVHIYRVSAGDFAFVASTESLSPDYSRLFKFGDFKKQLENIGVVTENDLQFRKISGRKTLEAVFDSYPVPANSDFFPVLDYGASKARFKRERAVSLIKLRESRLIREVLAEAPYQFETVTPSIYDSDTDEFNRVQAFYGQLEYKLSSEGRARFLSTGVDSYSSWLSAFLQSCGEDIEPYQDQSTDKLIDVVSWLFRYSSKEKLEPLLERIAACNVDRLRPLARDWLDIHRQWLASDYEAVYMTSNRIMSNTEFDTKLSRKNLAFNLAAQMMLGERKPFVRELTAETLDLMRADVELRGLIQMYQSKDREYSRF
ncbi:fused MFS/spermidine synthase [Pseudoteredinibacter isoporae]|uniref:fused MFS/spermidine synthase n=1 Tax=Pseudoteredinibacter isoporae TaxID=570281 RepID=UPI00310A2294